jgi:hypothetical protein
MNKESTEGDIGCGLLTIDGYLNNLKKYYKYEVANIGKAKAAGVGKEHLMLIMGRIDIVKAEIAEME